MPIEHLKRLINKPKTELSHEEIFDAVFENIKTRQSVRKYKSTPVKTSQIEKLMLAAAHAPSAGNHQPWEFIIIKDKVKKQHIAESCFEQEWMNTAPLFIIACVNMRMASAVYGERGERLYGVQDVAAATQNILLTAHAMGLGSCWVGAFSEPAIKTVVELPEYVRPAAIITIGYPDETPDVTERHPITETTHFETFSNTITEMNSGAH